MGGHTATECLTHLLEMKNGNIDGSDSRVRGSRRDGLTKRLGRRRMEEEAPPQEGEPAPAVISGVTIQASH